MPEKEDAHLTPATRLLEKRREMAEVESSLTAEKEVHFQEIWNISSLNFFLIYNLKKQEFHMKMESLSQRKQELEKKEVQLKESVVKFDKFLKVIVHDIG